MTDIGYFELTTYFYSLVSTGISMAENRYKNKSKIANGIITVAFGLLLLSVIPTILGNSSIIQSALPQT
jgi:hypothetical protein